jgi:hypothetical protein
VKRCVFLIVDSAQETFNKTRRQGSFKRSELGDGRFFENHGDSIDPCDIEFHKSDPVRWNDPRDDQSLQSTVYSEHNFNCRTSFHLRQIRPSWSNFQLEFGGMARTTLRRRGEQRNRSRAKMHEPSFLRLRAD